MLHNPGMADDLEQQYRALVERVRRYPMPEAVRGGDPGRDRGDVSAGKGGESAEFHFQPVGAKASPRYQPSMQPRHEGGASSSGYRPSPAGHARKARDFGLGL